MKKILVANRGEIAIRVMRSAREMGIHTVAVFSEADRNSPHVRFADESVCIGPAPSAQSYLVMEKIIEVSKLLNVDAIHPGYGFLSENAAFARKVRDAGITFIGPSPESMEMMGSKIAAKDTAKNNHVPLVPGTNEPVKEISAAKNIATQIGYPVLIKASAGGGGKGMRVVKEEHEFEEQVTRAMSEAKAAFGDGSVFIEKYMNSPRHIEIQVLGDQHGNVVHLFERECSVQRRHQKLIEEAPSSVLSDDLRMKMGASAVALAKACGYSNAGTVEFLVDEKLNYYFLEMNTRLQVEHPTTEMITGLDLVKEQIRIAAGEKLSFKQEDISRHGHAIELRVCAEDPYNNFLPDIGNLETYRIPQGPGVRVDDGAEAGMEIPIYYDPLFAKLVVFDQNRGAAIQKMIRAINEFQISGIKTTLEFGKWVMEHPAFIEGKFDTGFIQKFFSPEKMNGTATKNEIEVAGLLAADMMHLNQNSTASNHSQTLTSNTSNWRKNRLKDN